MPCSTSRTRRSAAGRPLGVEPLLQVGELGAHGGERLLAVGLVAVEAGGRVGVDRGEVDGPGGEAQVGGDVVVMGTSWPPDCGQAQACAAPMRSSSVRPHAEGGEAEEQRHVLAVGLRAPRRRTSRSATNSVLPIASWPSRTPATELVGRPAAASKPTQQEERRDDARHDPARRGGTMPLRGRRAGRQAVEEDDPGRHHEAGDRGDEAEVPHRQGDRVAPSRPSGDGRRGELRGATRSRAVAGGSCGSSADSDWRRLIAGLLPAAARQARSSTSPPFRSPDRATRGAGMPGERGCRCRRPTVVCRCATLSARGPRVTTGGSTRPGEVDPALGEAPGVVGLDDRLRLLVDHHGAGLGDVPLAELVHQLEGAAGVGDVVGDEHLRGPTGRSRPGWAAA